MTASTHLHATTALVVAAADGLHLPDRADPVRLDGRIDDLAVDGAAVWALVDGSTLHRVDADATATRMATLTEGRATCVHVQDDTVWVGGDEAALWRLRGDTLEPVASFAHAPTRAEWHTPRGGPPSVLSIASRGNDLYVGVHVGGILHSPDGGETWRDTIDLHLDVHEVVVDPDDGTVWAATGQQGVARSSDRGASWEHLTDGLHATYCLAIARTGDGVLAGASSGHAGHDGRLYRLDGTRFVRVGDGFPQRLDGAIGPRDIAGSGDHAAVLLPDGRVVTSDDGGHHWTDAGVAGATAVALR